MQESFYCLSKDLDSEFSRPLHLFGDLMFKKCHQSYERAHPVDIPFLIMIKVSGNKSELIASHWSTNLVMIL